MKVYVEKFEMEYRGGTFLYHKKNVFDGYFGYLTLQGMLFYETL